MPTAKNRLQILNLHPKKQNKKNFKCTFAEVLPKSQMNILQNYYRHYDKITCLTNLQRI